MLRFKFLIFEAYCKIGYRLCNNNIFQMQSIGFLARSVGRVRFGSSIGVRRFDSAFRRSVSSEVLQGKDQHGFETKNPAKQNAKLTVSYIKGCTTAYDLLELADSANPNLAKEILLRLGEMCIAGKIARISLEKDARFQSLVSKAQNAIASKPEPESRAQVNNAETLTQRAEPNAGPGPVARKQFIKPISLLTQIVAEKTEANIINDMNTSQLVQALSSFSRESVRCQSTLRHVAEKIVAKNDPLKLKDYSDILYSMAKLSFYDDALLSSVSKNVQKLLAGEEKHPTYIGSIITSIGYLRYKDESMIDALINWVMQNKTLLRPKDLASVLSTLASVNYQSQFTTELAKSIHTKQLTPTEQLDFVWSLLVLDSAKDSNFRRVLS